MHQKIKQIMIAMFLVSYANIALAQISYRLDEDDDDQNVHTISDPLQYLNRTIYGMNFITDQMILKPAASVYLTITPKVVQKGFNNFFYNFQEPIHAVNHLFQGKNKLAKDALWRFFINGVFGVGGVFDVAKYQGYTRAKNNFETSLAYHCVTPGFYIVVPLLGPMSIRGAAGKLLDYSTNPLNYVLSKDVAKVKFATEGIVARANYMDEYNMLTRSSFDNYITIRNVVTQSENYISAKFKDKCIDKE